MYVISEKDEVIINLDNVTDIRPAGRLTSFTYINGNLDLVTFEFKHVLDKFARCLNIEDDYVRL